MPARNRPEPPPTVRWRRAGTALLLSGGLVAAAAIPALPSLATARPSGAGTAAATATTASTDEVYRVPARRVFTILGRGFGHGRGMSQWGAAHAAEIGKTVTQILDFYYPHTDLAAAGNPWTKVALTGTGNGSTTVGYGASGSHRYQCSDATQPATSCTLVVDATPGLVVTSGGAHPTLSGATKWRVLVKPDGLHLAGLVSGSWKSAPIGGQAATAGPVTFSGPTFVKVDYGATQRDYRGIVSAVRTSAAGESPARMIRLDTLHLDAYVRGVVYRESYASWKLAALEAQSVAARTYAARYRHDSRAASLPYDICDSTYCQVFSGSRLYQGSTSTWLEPDPDDPAHDPVAQTADQVLMWQGLPLFAEFSASNGGWTAGGATDATPVYDPWDYHSDDPYHRWTLTLSASSLEAQYGFDRLDKLVVTQRDGTSAQWGGRVRALQLVGVDSGGNPRTVTLADPSSVRLGLRSSFWTVRTVSVGGPAGAARGSYVTLSGSGNPGSQVTVWTRPQGNADFATARTVTIGDDGSYTAKVWVNRDTAYYATSDGTRSATHSVDVTGTTASGPATAPLGTTVNVTGYAEPGSTVTLHLKRAGATSYHAAGTATAGSKAVYRLPFVADDDYSYYTSAAGHSSPVRQLTAMLTLTGPETADRASVVTLDGHAQPGASVAVYRKAQNWSAFQKVATVTADGSGRYSVHYRATVDSDYYAASTGRTSATGHTRALGTTISGPATARTGSWVRLTGYAAPGSTVTVYLRKGSSTVWTTRPETTAGAKGWWSRYYLASDSATYYAVAAGYTSVTGSTQAV